MRNEIETAEITDADLDNVSGGLGVSLEGVAGLAGTQVGGNASVGIDLPVELPQLPSVPGLGGVTNTVTGLL